MYVKTPLNIWAWRPWAFLVSVLLLGVWAEIGYFYFWPVTAGTEAPSQIQALIAEHIGRSAIEDYWLIWLAGFLAYVIISSYFGLIAVKAFVKDMHLRYYESIILHNLPACTDEEIVDYNMDLGIVVDPTGITIPVRLLNHADPEKLARNICCLLHMDWPEIASLYSRGRHTALHKLADILLENFPDGKIGEFTQAMCCEKRCIGRALELALRRRRLEQKIDALSAQVEGCLRDEIDNVEIDHSELSSDGVIGTAIIKYQQLLKPKETAKGFNFSQLSRLGRKGLSSTQAAQQN